MSVQITSDNIELSSSMATLAEQKIVKLLNHLKDVPKDLVGVRVVLNAGPQETFDANVELTINGKVFYSEENDFTLESALVEAIDEVNRQYLKAKSKIATDAWKEQREAKRFPEEDLNDTE